MTGTVFNPTSISQADGTTNLMDTLGKAGEQLVAELHGKYYTQTYRGTLFYASSAPGTPVVIPAFGATSITGLPLWNPAGSNKNIIPVRLTIAQITAASVANTKGWTILQNAGSTLATAAPMSVFTQITATRGCGLSNQALGVGNSVALVGSAATLTAACTTFCSMGFTLGTGAVTVPSQQSVFSYDFDGTLVIQPGSVFIPAGSVADTGTYNLSLTWYEAPL